MLPLPTRAGIAAYFGAAAALLIGIATGSPVVTGITAGMFIVIALALALTMPLGRRVRRMQLEFAWWSTAQNVEGAVIPGSPFEVRCFIRHRARFAITVNGIEPIVPAGSRVTDAESRTLALEPSVRTEFRFRMVADAIGRTTLHGLAVRIPGRWGLFEIPLYFPNPLVIKVLPRVAARSRHSLLARGGSPVERHGRLQHRRRGGGTELHELRDFVPGDPFKSIAWKASARRGHLMVREVEQEVQQTNWIILEAGGTMRGGALGQRPLDAAMDVAATDARHAIDHGDRVGFVTVDGRIVRFVSPGDDRGHMLRIYDALIGISEVVDEDLTELDDDALERIVGEYLQRQDGVDFTAHTGIARWDLGRMLRHVQRQLAHTGEPPPVASDASGVLLRRFCRERGIPLPYRRTAPAGTKCEGIFLALRHVVAHEHAPSVITVITDFDDVLDEAGLRTTLRLLRGRGHEVIFALTAAHRIPSQPQSGVQWASQVAVSRAEEARLARLRRVIVQSGGRFASLPVGAAKKSVGAVAPLEASDSLEADTRGEAA